METEEARTAVGATEEVPEWELPVDGGRVEPRMGLLVFDGTRAGLVRVRDDDACRLDMVALSGMWAN